MSFIFYVKTLQGGRGEAGGAGPARQEERVALVHRVHAIQRRGELGAHGESASEE
jgi:hypothetical protein